MAVEGCLPLDVHMARWSGGCMLNVDPGTAGMGKMYTAVVELKVACISTGVKANYFIGGA